MGLKVPLNISGTMERRPLKERHEVCVWLSLQGSSVERKVVASRPTSGPGGPAPAGPGAQLHTCLQHGLSRSGGVC